MTSEMGPTPPAWQPALAVLDEITRRTEAGAVLRACYRAGLLDRLTRPSPLDELARASGLDEGRLVAALGVLESLGVAAVEGGSWTLTPSWAAVVDGQSPADLDGYLHAPRVRMTQFENCLTGGDDYWQLSPEDRLLVARGVSFNPASPLMPAMLRRDLGLLDGVVDALDAGGRALELGCGVGSRLTALALTFPDMRGVGIELDAQLAAYGRDRADALGVGERVTYVVADATQYEPDAAFDLVNWSQFFFPTATREAALGVAWRAIRPGGWVTAPVIWPDEAGPTTGSDAEELALEALNLTMWGVPARTTGDVCAEMEAAGFVEVRVDDMTFINLVRGRRPGSGESGSGDSGSASQ